MDQEDMLSSHRLGRRRLLTASATVLMAFRSGNRGAAIDGTPTPTATAAPSGAGKSEASPVTSPVASPAITGPVFESTMRSLKYLPAKIDIEAGTTVIWTNKDVVAHTVTHKVKVEDQLFASPFISPGENFSFTFDKPGTYPVYCLPHPFMTQTVVVSAKR